MNALLVELAVRGTLVSVIVLLLDRMLDRYQRAEWRKLWWVIVPFAWILPFHLPHRSSIPSLPIDRPLQLAIELLDRVDRRTAAGLPFHALLDWRQLAVDTWLAGALISFGVIAIRTIITARKWSGVRLSTDRALLELLEDCKATAGVSAPIGLVVNPDVSSPALLGWLRPRILLPATLARTMSREELGGVFFHELAHFRAADIPIQWAFCLGQSLHWFNPVAHLATRRWMYFRELAADATALAWLPEASRNVYGHALIAAVREANPLPVPRGALALGESFQQLKLRITMITQSQSRSRLVWLATLVSLALLAVVLLPRTLRADPTTTPTEGAAKSLARSAGDGWLNTIDNSDYAESWASASAMFKTQITSDKWVEALTHVRAPLGKILSRNFASAAYQKDPVSGQTTVVGEFVIEQFDSTFENLKHATETISLMKDPDGQWRAAGYLIKP